MIWLWLWLSSPAIKKRKLGFFFQENIYNGTRIMPLYRCFQRANLDTPHDQRKFCMQFWRMRIDSHAVSHFTELWGQPQFILNHTVVTKMVILHFFWHQNVTSPIHALFSNKKTNVSFLPV